MASYPHGARDAEDYNRILNTLGRPNYAVIRDLFSKDRGVQPDTAPSIQISFELFEAVQTRLANTKQTLERTKTALHKSNQEHADMLVQLRTLKEDYSALEKRSQESDERQRELRMTNAKLDATIEQLRMEVSQMRTEMDGTQEKLMLQEDRLQDSQNKVAEALVTISQKEATITALRRELNKHIRRSTGGGPGGGLGGKSGLGDEKGKKETGEEALQNIRADVENRAQEVRQKLSVAQLRELLSKVEQENLHILRQHQQYVKHVQRMIAAYETHTMCFEDAAASHKCVKTPYYLCSTFYEEYLHPEYFSDQREEEESIRTLGALTDEEEKTLAALMTEGRSTADLKGGVGEEAEEEEDGEDDGEESISGSSSAGSPLLLPNSGEGRATETLPSLSLLRRGENASVLGENLSTTMKKKKRKKKGEKVLAAQDAVMMLRTFRGLTFEVHRGLNRMERVDIDDGCRIKSELTTCVRGHTQALDVMAQLVSFLSTWEAEVTRERLSMRELREEWIKARVPFFVKKVAANLTESITAFSKGLVEVLKRENEVRLGDEEAEEERKRRESETEEAAEARRQQRRSIGVSPLPSRDTSPMLDGGSDWEKPPGAHRGSRRGSKSEEDGNQSVSSSFGSGNGSMSRRGGDRPHHSNRHGSRRRGRHRSHDQRQTKGSRDDSTRESGERSHLRHTSTSTTRVKSRSSSDIAEVEEGERGHEQGRRRGSPLPAHRTSRRRSSLSFSSDSSGSSWSGGTSSEEGGRGYRSRRDPPRIQKVYLTTVKDTKDGTVFPTEEFVFESDDSPQHTRRRKHHRYRHHASKRTKKTDEDGAEQEKGASEEDEDKGQDEFSTEGRMEGVCITTCFPSEGTAGGIGKAQKKKKMKKKKKTRTVAKTSTAAGAGKLQKKKPPTSPTTKKTKKEENSPRRGGTTPKKPETTLISSALLADITTPNAADVKHRDMKDHEKKADAEEEEEEEETTTDDDEDDEDEKPVEDTGRVSRIHIFPQRGGAIRIVVEEGGHPSVSSLVTSTTPSMASTMESKPFSSAPPPPRLPPPLPTTSTVVVEGEGEVPRHTIATGRTSFYVSRSLLHVGEEDDEEGEEEEGGGGGRRPPHHRRHQRHRRRTGPYASHTSDALDGASAASSRLEEREREEGSGSLSGDVMSGTASRPSQLRRSPPRPTSNRPASLAHTSSSASLSSSMSSSSSLMGGDRRHGRLPRVSYASGTKVVGLQPGPVGSFRLTSSSRHFSWSSSSLSFPAPVVSGGTLVDSLHTTTLDHDHSLLMEKSGGPHSGLLRDHTEDSHSEEEEEDDGVYHTSMKQLGRLPPGSTITSHYYPPFPPGGEEDAMDGSHTMDPSLSDGKYLSPPHTRAGHTSPRGSVEGGGGAPGLGFPSGRLGVHRGTTTTTMSRKSTSGIRMSSNTELGHGVWMASRGMAWSGWDDEEEEEVETSQGRGGRRTAWIQTPSTTTMTRFIVRCGQCQQEITISFPSSMTATNSHSIVFSGGALLGLPLSSSSHGSASSRSSAVSVKGKTLGSSFLQRSVPRDSFGGTLLREEDEGRRVLSVEEDGDEGGGGGGGERRSPHGAPFRLVPRGLETARGEEGTARLSTVSGVGGGIGWMGGDGEEEDMTQGTNKREERRGSMGAPFSTIPLYSTQMGDRASGSSPPSLHGGQVEEPGRRSASLMRRSSPELRRGSRAGSSVPSGSYASGRLRYNSVGGSVTTAGIGAAHHLNEGGGGETSTSLVLVGASHPSLVGMDGKRGGGVGSSSSSPNPSPPLRASLSGDGLAPPFGSSMFLQGTSMAIHPTSTRPPSAVGDRGVIRRVKERYEKKLEAQETSLEKFRTAIEKVVEVVQTGVDEHRPLRQVAKAMEEIWKELFALWEKTAGVAGGGGEDSGRLGGGEGGEEEESKRKSSRGSFPTPRVRSSDGAAWIAEPSSRFSFLGRPPPPFLRIPDDDDDVGGVEMVDGKRQQKLRLGEGGAATGGKAGGSRRGSKLDGTQGSARPRTNGSTTAPSTLKKKKRKSEKPKMTQATVDRLYQPKRRVPPVASGTTWSSGGIVYSTSTGIYKMEEPMASVPPLFHGSARASEMAAMLRMMGGSGGGAPEGSVEKDQNTDMRRSGPYGSPLRFIPSMSGRAVGSSLASFSHPPLSSSPIPFPLLSSSSIGGTGGGGHAHPPTFNPTPLTFPGYMEHGHPIQTGDGDEGEGGGMENARMANGGGITTTGPTTTTAVSAHIPTTLMTFPIQSPYERNSSGGGGGIDSPFSSPLRGSYSGLPRSAPFSPSSALPPFPTPVPLGLPSLSSLFPSSSSGLYTRMHPRQSWIAQQLLRMNEKGLLLARHGLVEKGGGETSPSSPSPPSTRTLGTPGSLQLGMAIGGIGVSSMSPKTSPPLPSMAPISGSSLGSGSIDPGRAPGGLGPMMGHGRVVGDQLFSTAASPQLSVVLSPSWRGLTPPGALAGSPLTNGWPREGRGWGGGGAAPLSPPSTHLMSAMRRQDVPPGRAGMGENEFTSVPHSPLWNALRHQPISRGIPPTSAFVRPRVWAMRGQRRRGGREGREQERAEGVESRVSGEERIPMASTSFQSNSSRALSASSSLRGGGGGRTSPPRSPIEARQRWSSLLAKRSAYMPTSKPYRNVHYNTSRVPG